MSKDLNRVQLMGRLGKDPETRYTPQGSAITKLAVASSRRWRTAEGEDREETEWFNVVAWNKLGEICAQYLQKGSRVYFEGRLQTRSWDDQATGQKRYMTEVIASDMIMLDSRRDSVGGGAPQFDEPDVGFPEPDIDQEPPARSFGQRGADGAQSSRAPSGQQPARQMSGGNGAPARSQQQRPAPSASAPRRPTAPPPTDEDDLPF